MSCKCKRTRPADEYPGVAINKADDNKETEKEVKERTETLNNNPRNHKNGD